MVSFFSSRQVKDIIPTSHSFISKTQRFTWDREPSTYKPTSETRVSSQKRPSCNPSRKQVTCSADCVSVGKRAVLLGLGAALFMWQQVGLGTKTAQAEGLRSMTSENPGVLTIRNAMEHPCKLLWINYDGEQYLLDWCPLPAIRESEFFGSVLPGQSMSVGTYETHPWRIVDTMTNKVLQEVTARKGHQLVLIEPKNAEVSQDLSKPSTGGGNLHFDGFDGIGGSEQLYAKAELVEVATDPSGGVMKLAVQGFKDPVPIAVALPEAASLLFASGWELRRPTMVGVWGRSLELSGAKVERVVINRSVGDIFYARIVLQSPGGQRASVDARASDSMALAVQCHSPMFVAKKVARIHQPDYGEDDSEGGPVELPPEAGQNPDSFLFI